MRGLIRMVFINIASTYNNSFLLNLLAAESAMRDQHLRIDKLLRSDFMKTPPTSKMNDIVHEFIERTGNEPLEMLICACCALEIETSEMTKTSLDTVPNHGLLVPADVHPEHDIFRGMLLEPKGVDVNAGTVNICHQCHVDLERNQLPPFALANNMWVGRVPECLQILTLAERVLIAKFFPTAYVVKLYPKQTGAAHWDHSQLYSGLKGSVSTYVLDPKLVGSMIDGKILPAPPLILSATIAVTFITPSGKPEFSFPKMLHVQRNNVRDALLWLKSHNPLYEDITISEERLQALPENGMPNEIISTAKYSTDMESVVREHEGYVPLDAAEEDIQGNSFRNDIEQDIILTYALRK